MEASLGPMLGAVLVAAAGPASAFAFDGLTFIASALCVIAMKVPQRPFARSESAPLDAKDEDRERSGIAGVLVDLREEVGNIFGSTWLRVIIPVASLSKVGLAVALPRKVNDGYGAGVAVYGAISAAGAIGTIAATLVIGQMHRLPRLGLVAHLTLALSCLALFTYGLPLLHGVAPALATGAAAIYGVGTGVFGLVWVTVLQELVPTEKLGRASRIDFLGSFVPAPVAKENAARQKERAVSGRGVETRTDG